MDGRDSPSRKAVLVVDDNRDAADALAALLSLEGYQATSVYGAQEAMERLDGGDGFSFVVSDVRMPEVDGFDFFRAVRHRYPDLRVILVTGKDLADEHQPHGAIVLRKPVAAADLLAAIQTP
jgi:CheY-like chemotaxis protein